MSKKQDKQALNAYQLASLMGSAGGMYAYHNPAQAQFAAAMTDSAKGSIAAQTEYMANKKAKEKSSSGLGTLAGTIAGAALAPATGGMSMAAGAALGGGIGGAAENVAVGNYSGAASNLASAMSPAVSAAGAPTGSGGTLQPVAKSLDENVPAMSAPPVDVQPKSVAASPSLEARKEGLAKMDFSTLETPQRYGMMSAMMDAGMQPTREQWNAMTPEEQKYWQERGVQPPQSKWVSGVQAVANALAGMGY